MIKGKVLVETFDYFVLTDVKKQNPDMSWTDLSGIDKDNKLEIYKHAIVFLSRNPN